MRIILDSNIVIAALMRDSHIRHLIFSSEQSLCFPQFMVDEIHSHKGLILEKSGMDESSYQQLLVKLLGKLSLIPTDLIKKHLGQATEIMKLIDVKDAPFIAAALSYPDAVIWSDDKDFEKQS
ncbi:MAG TPA: PIN domain-containing protein, partial [Candidatus Nanoarchaeia archaeon]|nr:PIN domain-containing protein [Candidatus Nanoarchaeia archaeon]